MIIHHKCVLFLFVVKLCLFYVSDVHVFPCDVFVCMHWCVMCAMPV